MKIKKKCLFWNKRKLPKNITVNTLMQAMETFLTLENLSKFEGVK